MTKQSTKQKTEQTSEQTDLQKQQLDALEAAQQQQLDALSTMREAAMESAKYWEDLAKQGAAEGAETQAATPTTPSQPSPTIVTNAHFAYLETVLKAQFDFTRTLMSGSSDQ